MICHVLMIAICKDIFCHVIFLSNYIVYEYKIPLLISEHNFDTFIIQLTIRIETFFSDMFIYVELKQNIKHRFNIDFNSTFLPVQNRDISISWRQYL